MPQATPQLDLDQLSISQRLDLIELLWDSIPEDLDSLPVPEWHREELERRLAAADAAPDDVIPWHEARSRLRGGP